ncbi:MAG TPA: MoxR family ATPase [Phycisphaerae bacterium]|nr:MoxR family ATPase [Phycisphaerae bacterium]
MTESQRQPDQSAGGSDLAAVERLRAAHDCIRAELAKVIMGQDRVVEELLIALFAGGHCILEGVPGLAKTLMISTLARSLNLSFSRIQFTPDLMPSDITGTEVIQEDKASGSRSFRFLRGPVFANMVLADEINRTPPKTQAALLEAMQERQVTVGGQRHKLDEPFFVLATQNPIEQEGTYPLPEAQQDRFMFKVFVDYPSYEEELLIAETTAADIAAARDSIPAVLDAGQVLQLQELVRKVPIARTVTAHALDLARRTRPAEPEAPEITRQMIRWGAGPRAVQFLVLAAKARAVLHGQYHAAIDDIRAMAHPVLRHRIVTTYSAEAQGYSADRIIDELLDQTPANESALTQDGRIRKVLGS